MSLSTERNNFKKQVQKINKSQSDDILYKKEGYAKDFLYKRRQQREA